MANRERTIPDHSKVVTSTEEFLAVQETWCRREIRNAEKNAPRCFPPRPLSDLAEKQDRE